MREELFYQLEGSITIITQENGERNVLELHGDMYLHLQSTPFPSRSEGSIGLVIERKEQDKAILTVYCGIASCNHKLHEVYFELNDIEKTLFLILNTFTSHWR
jgi:3-hydroxyanthranilate 3,4-dioxygenase